MAEVQWLLPPPLLLHHSDAGAAPDCLQDFGAGLEIDSIGRLFQAQAVPQAKA